MAEWEDNQGDYSSDRMRDMTARRSHIGPIRAVKDPKRREKCAHDLALFLQTYGADSFPRPFCEDHLALIDTLQTVILGGGRFIQCMPRGYGKSTICEWACIWAAIYGHRAMVPLLSTVKDTAIKSMRSIKSELESNELLAEDFPEICQPVAALEGMAQRAGSQTYAKENEEKAHTFIEWKTEEIVFPTIEGSPSSGVVLCVYGIESRRARGLRYKRRDGVQARPDFFLIDDPQDDKIAGNPPRVAKLLQTINRSVLMSTGHDKKAACVIIATVIEKNDAADQLLRDTAWIGRRVQMLRTLPKNLPLWQDDYKRLRNDYRDGSAKDKRRAEKKATDFYKAHRADMDEGAAASWRECKAEEEISAIQHAMNIWLDLGDRAFFSECQNAPIDPFAMEGNAPLEPRDILAKVTTLPRGTCPLWSHTLTAFVDVGGRTNLHFAVVAYGARYSCHVVDYGIVKVQKSAGVGIEAALTDALDRVASALIGRAYLVENGTGEKRLDRVLVDSGWQARTVYNFARERERTSPGLIRPSKGYGADRYRTPRPGTGARRGDNWHLGLSENRAAYLIHYNADHWKSFSAERLRVGLGGAGALSICRGDHGDFAEHLSSERPQRKKTRHGDEVDAWRILPGRSNHWWDCVVGAMVAASTCGVVLEEVPSAAGAASRSRPRIKVAKTYEM